MPSIPRIHQLNTGAFIPSVGFGTWKLTNEDQSGYNAIKTAIKSGYRHFDTAYGYQNESVVGRGIRDGLKEAGLKREDIFVTTKLAPICSRPANVKPAFERSLELLDIGYIDLYLIHWPVALSPDSGELIPLKPDGTRDIDEELKGQFEVTWAAMEKLIETGKVRSIGVSNFSIHNLERLLASAKVVPAVNQIEGHPYLPQFELLDYCASKNIHITQYSPLGSSNGEVLKDPTLVQIAEKYQVSVAQIIISWGALRGSTIPKSSNPSRIQSNIQTVDLTDEDIKTINDISKTHTKRYLKPDWGVPVFDEDFKNL
ncbi:NADP-dependent oxidoreductase domain-containing protein [Cunninghamella echinulata]|nr:NADP-dependent oxidoreductase domain-containing protein [Cunninghamella echinulata]